MHLIQKASVDIHIRLEPQQEARLHALARSRHATISALVRYAIDRLLEVEDAAADGNEIAR